MVGAHGRYTLGIAGYIGLISIIIAVVARDADVMKFANLEINFKLFKFRLKINYIRNIYILF